MSALEVNNSLWKAVGTPKGLLKFVLPWYRRWMHQTSLTGADTRRYYERKCRLVAAGFLQPVRKLFNPVYQNVLDISDQLADGIRNSEEIEKAKSDLQLLQSSQFSIADFFISFLSPDAFDDENLPRHYRIFDWLLSRDVVWKMYDIITCAESILKEHALIRSIPLQEEDICIFMAETIRDVFPPPHAGRERLERIAFSKMTVALAQACKISPNWEITEALRRSLEAEDNAEPLLTDHFSLLSSHHKGCWVIDIILESTKIRFMK